MFGSPESEDPVSFRLVFKDKPLDTEGRQNPRLIKQIVDLLNNAYSQGIADVQAETITHEVANDQAEPTQKKKSATKKSATKKTSKKTEVDEDK